MRKLFAGFIVIAAIVALYFLAIKPIEDESQSQHQHQKQNNQGKKHKQTLKPSPENSWAVPFPHIQGQTINVEAFWAARKGKPPFTEVVAWPRAGEFSQVSAPNVVRFVSDSEGIHLRKDSKAEVLQAEIVYSNRDRSDLYEHVAPWDGNGNVARTMTVTVNRKRYTLRLTEIVVLAHDSRYYSDQEAKTQSA